MIITIKIDRFFKQKTTISPFLKTAFVIALMSVNFFMPVSASQGGGELDSDNDGLSDSYEIKIGTEPFLSDTDGDGIQDSIEVGKDLENPQNHDNDRLIDARDSDDDNDGLPTILETDADTDQDGIKNYLDMDSDNDGVNDGVEAGLTGKDSDFDKIDDAFDADYLKSTDENGDGIADSVVFPDYNNDSIPDFLDKKFAVAKTGLKKGKPGKDLNQLQIAGNRDTPASVEKHATKKINLPVTRQNNPKLAAPEIAKAAVSIEQEEKKSLSDRSSDSVKKPSISTLDKNVTDKDPANKDIANKDKVTSKVLNIAVTDETDSDNDGLTDAYEKIQGTNPHKRDSDGDKVSDAIEIGIDPLHPQDSDHDGIIDALDDDDDNDGILTRNEDLNKDGSPINDDTDRDGVPNYQDANDDGDTRLTLEEGEFADTDKDGIPDYLDKNDGRIADKNESGMAPELVVLYDRQGEEMPAELSFTKNERITNNNESDESQALDDQLVSLKYKESTHHSSSDSNPDSNRVMKALDKAIAKHSKPAIRKENLSKDGNTKIDSGKLSRKIQVPLREQHDGFISWLTSLWKD